MGVREVRGASSDHRGNRRPALTQQRQHALPQIVAIKSLIDIAVVVHPGHGTGARERFEFAARLTEQGAQQPALAEPRALTHGRQTRYTRAAQQLQQEGFELIVQMMRGEQQLARGHRARECGVTHLTRLGFERSTRPLRHAHAAHHERDLEGRAETATVLFPGSRRGTQLMIDVHRSQRESAPTRAAPAQLLQRQKQRHRIDAATERHAKSGEAPACERALKRSLQSQREPTRQLSRLRPRALQPSASVNTPKPAILLERSSSNCSMDLARRSCR